MIGLRPLAELKVPEEGAGTTQLHCYQLSSLWKHAES